MQGHNICFLLRNKKRKCLSIAITVRKIIFELSLIPLLSGALSLHIFLFLGRNKKKIPKLCSLPHFIWTAHLMFQS